LAVGGIRIVLGALTFKQIVEKALLEKNPETFFSIFFRFCLSISTPNSLNYILGPKKGRKVVESFEKKF
jgi:hypothetical protein